MSGELIPQARESAGLSQTELARRVGVAQSVISAYGNCRRQPGAGVLARLVEAAGHSLRVERFRCPVGREGFPLRQPVDVCAATERL